jgi:acyl-CoA thioesterase FadM
MDKWTETYRGSVPPWQCDTTEHFTIAYYFDRLEEAEANLGDLLGIKFPLPRGAITARFVRELRAGAGFHVESAALGVENGLRLGHRFIDSGNGETVSWFQEQWDIALTPQQRETIGQNLGEWGGPATEPRPEPTSTAGFIPTARGRVKTADVNAAGQFALGAMVHRFSAASGQLAAALGMDGGATREQRRGFSTFELSLQLSGTLPLDAPYIVETGIGHLGNSSLRMIHRLTNQRTGIVIARLGQFGVNLDLDARRPVRWPDEVRNKAAALIVDPDRA